MCGRMGLRGKHVTHWVSDPWGHVALNVLRPKVQNTYTPFSMPTQCYSWRLPNENQV